MKIHTLAQIYTWPTLYSIIYCSILLNGLLRANVFHVFVANHLTGEQMGIFVSENDKFFCFTRYYSIYVWKCMHEKISLSPAKIRCQEKKRKKKNDVLINLEPKWDMFQRKEYTREVLGSLLDEKYHGNWNAITLSKNRVEIEVFAWVRIIVSTSD